MRTVLVDFTVPGWAQCFSVVRQAMDREATQEVRGGLSGGMLGAVTLTFEQDQADWIEAPADLRRFLAQVRIGHDERLTNEVGCDLVRHHDARRYEPRVVSGAFEWVETHATWVQGDDDVLNVKDLLEVLNECGREALIERIRGVAERCGQSMVAVGNISQPADDLLFAMAVVARDARLVQLLATPDRVNEPLLGFGFGTSALHRALSDNDVETMGVLLTHGARTDVRISPNSRTTLADVAEDPDEEIEDRPRDLMRSARAREAAVAALCSLHAVAAP